MTGESSEAARLLASRRPVGTVTCEECGLVFQGTSRRRYCSNTCNVRAWRRRRMETGDAGAKSPSTSMNLEFTPPGRRPQLDFAARPALESRLAIANLRTALARLRQTTSRGLPKEAEIADFESASQALHDALARQKIAASEALSSLQAARGQAGILGRGVPAASPHWGQP